MGEWVGGLLSDVAAVCSFLSLLSHFKTSQILQGKKPLHWEQPPPPPAISMHSLAIIANVDNWD